MPADGAAHPDAVQVVIERIDLIDAQVEQFLPIAERICKNQNPIHRQGLTYWRSVLNTLRNYLRKCEAIVLVHADSLEAHSSEHMFRLTKIQDKIAETVAALEPQLALFLCHD